MRALLDSRSPWHYETGQMSRTVCQSIGQEPERTQVTGTIRKILKDKGFGFIEPDDGSDDVFFHRGSGAPRVQFEDFGEGDSVQFQTRAGDKGPVAFGMKLR